MRAKGAAAAIALLTVVASCRALVGYEDTEVTSGPGGADGGIEAAAGASGGGGTGASAGIGGSAGESGAAGIGGAAGIAGAAGSGDAGVPPLWICDPVFTDPKLGLDLQPEADPMRTIDQLSAPRIALQEVMLGFAAHSPGSLPLRWILGDRTEVRTGSHPTESRPLHAAVVGNNKVGMLLARAVEDGGVGEALSLRQYPLDEPYYTSESIFTSPTAFAPAGKIMNVKFVSDANNATKGGFVADVYDNVTWKGYAGTYSSTAEDVSVIYQGNERDRLLLARSEQDAKLFVFARDATTSKFVSYVLAEPHSLLSSTEFGNEDLELKDVAVDGKGVLRLFAWDTQGEVVLLGSVDSGLANAVTHQDVAPATSQPSAEFSAAVATMRWGGVDLLGVAPSADGKGIDAVWYHNGVLRFEGPLISGMTGTVIQAVAVVDPDTSQPGFWVMWVHQYNGTPTIFHRVLYQRFGCSETT